MCSREVPAFSTCLFFSGVPLLRAPLRCNRSGSSRQHVSFFGRRLNSFAWTSTHVSRAPRLRARWISQQRISEEGQNGNPKKKPRRGRKEESPYRATVNLPATEFSQRANAVKREPEIQRMWETRNVYRRLSREGDGELFILHDGPPYANGQLHMGHALNKILKDFLNRYHLLRGRRAVFVPGWDCHGLPIELKVLQSLSSKERKGMNTNNLRLRAAAFAQSTVEHQMQAFKRFAVWGDWDKPYLTLDRSYEAAQIGIFGAMYLKGYIFRGFKPVHWSPSSRTALAEAELEYPEEHTSPSVYCTFDVVDVPKDCDSEIAELKELGSLKLSVWTTTPWTLPGNRAVAINPKLEYSFVRGLNSASPNDVVIIAKDLIETVAGKLDSQASVKTLASVSGDKLVGITYKHPLLPDKTCPVVTGGDYITTESGTGLVHTAPGHGQEDYAVGMREGLELASPVNHAGKFTGEAGEFKGLSVLTDGTKAVIKKMQDIGSLLLEEPYKHKYPYDWRTKKPTIMRATDQWFASIEGFRNDVLEAIKSVQWLPEAGINRIRSMVEGRSDWCISRQRSWGVPIPVFYTEANEPVMNEETINFVQKIIAKEGADAWWEYEADELLPYSYREKGLRRGTDTMDVWFDSGSSWGAVADNRKELCYPANLYLEGSDQHRGWFQSSLLTSVAVRGHAPYKAVLTHGFVLDERGIKMSKSVGNVVDPMTIIQGGNNLKSEPPYGADVLRLWVASVDYTGDVLIGSSIIKQVSDVYRKLRNTVRYMLGNLADFDPELHTTPYDELPNLDKYMLSRLSKLCTEVQDAYDGYSFYKVYQALQRFAVVELSNFYLDIAKDRLYISELENIRRRSCQTVLKAVLENYAKAMAPILPHMAEDIWENIPYERKGSDVRFEEPQSVFESGWLQREGYWEDLPEDVCEAWDFVVELRDVVNRALEAARAKKAIGASLDAKVILYSKDEGKMLMLRRLLQCDNSVDELRRAFIVSEVEVTSDESVVVECEFNNVEEKDADVLVGVGKAEGTKCDRCWHYSEEVGNCKAHPALCDRCVDAVLKMGILEAPVQPQQVA